jgi:hypothetical protein
MAAVGCALAIATDRLDAATSKGPSVSTAFHQPVMFEPV